MVKFKKISLNQIMVFSEIIGSTSLQNVDFIKRRYLKDAIEFENIIYFLDKINCIKVKANSITMASDYKILLTKMKIAKKQDYLLQEYLLSSFIVKENKFSKYLKDFFSKFSLEGNMYILIPSISERILYGDLRDFLIELGVLVIDPIKNSYSVANKYIIHIISNLSKSISPQQLVRDMQNKYEIGIRAENQIIKYEINRLIKYPYLAERVEHIALKDVSAGYDIKSFELNKKPIHRFIEVKAVSLKDFKFIWSRNEIEKSRIYRKSYFLYLLPVKNSVEFEIGQLKIIKDPYKNVYRNKKCWFCIEELLSCSSKI